MKFYLLLSLLLLSAMPQNVLAGGKDTVLSTETNSKVILSKAFYVYKPEPYRGKKAVFRMKVKRTEGQAPLGCRFRCSTDKGLQATKTYPVKYTRNGETVPVELILDIPNLDNIKHFNVSVAFRRRGLGKCVWEISDAGFAEYKSAAPAEKPKEDAEPKAVLPAGMPAGITADKAASPLVLVKDGKVCFVIVTADKPTFGSFLTIDRFGTLTLGK